MVRPEPVYTSVNTRPAYQLNWAVSIFWRATQDGSAPWLGALRRVLETDKIRILNHRFRSPQVSQFLISTRPETKPCDFLRLLKGRLQHLVREEQPKAFHRNYHFASVGAADQTTVARYIAKQVEHYDLADPRMTDLLQRVNAGAGMISDLSTERTSEHGHFNYNLHVVLCYVGRWRAGDEEFLGQVKGRIRATAEKHCWRLGSHSVLCDHMHLEVGINPTSAPGEVALSFMNNIAHLCGMRPLLQYSYYVGTIGPYTRGACTGER